MTTHPVSGRTSHLAIAAGILMALLLAVPLVASAQTPLPVTRLAYSAKFSCGGVPRPSPAEPSPLEETVVEVHNPHTVPVTVTIKWIVDYPFDLVAIGPYDVTLAPNQGLNLDCDTFYLPGCPPICGGYFRGFVEISCTQQVKVVAQYKAYSRSPGRAASVSLAKKSSPAFVIAGSVRHSATFMVGDQVTAVGDTVRHETTVSIANMSNNSVNANVSIVSKTGVVTSFPKFLQPNGFTTVTGADLPPSVPLPFVGGVTVQYPDMGFGAMLECEEIIRNELFVGSLDGGISISVVEVQPIPIRQ
ncbi:MAG: hypothetical protein A2W00_08975 [Candidatus Eisenbacteria bacterium RBG_16_71_46]|nr:MAG: hypothetical protein A2W00_08975 [Candidatus Eisenbacteria bacterium RBG_16_71_46]